MRTKKKEKNLDGNMKVEEILDRKNALMRYLQEALGKIIRKNYVFSHLFHYPVLEKC